MDDLITTHKDVNETYCMFEKTRERLNEAGFKFHKWKTNVQLLAQSIAMKEAAIETESKIQDPVMEKSDHIIAKTKVLGLVWDKEKDSVEFDLHNIVEGTKSVTKRSILCTMAAVFDPLGLICPISVAANVLFQDICMEKSGWDDPLFQDKLQRWEEWLKGLKNTKVIRIPLGIYWRDRKVRLLRQVQMDFLMQERKPTVLQSILCVKQQAEFIPYCFPQI